MALVKNNVKDSLKTALDAALAVDDPENQEAALNAWCDAVAQVIVDSVKTGVDDTLVTFTLAAPNGPVTGTITLTAQVT